MVQWTTKDLVNRKKPGRGGSLNLKDEGVLYGWFHPLGGFHGRKVHGFFRWPTGEKGKSTGRFFVCSEDDKCPLCILKEFAERKLADGYEGDEVILSGGSGKKRKEFDLNDLDQSSYPNEMTKATGEFVFAWVPGDKKNRKEHGIVRMTTKQSLGFAVQDVIKNKIEERGEDVGDPMISPYPFKLVYDKNANTAGDYYKAFEAGEKNAKMTKRVRALLEKDPGGDEFKADPARACKPPDPAKVMEALEAAWDSDNIEFDEFEAYYAARSGSKKKGKKGKTKKGKAKKSKPASKKGKAKKGKAKKGKAKKGKAKGGKAKTYCEECEEKVKPKKDGRCPYCGTMLDVPF